MLCPSNLYRIIPNNPGVLRDVGALVRCAASWTGATREKTGNKTQEQLLAKKVGVYGGSEQTNNPLQMQK